MPTCLICFETACVQKDLWSGARHVLCFTAAGAEGVQARMQNWPRAVRHRRFKHHGMAAWVPELRSNGAPLHMRLLPRLVASGGSHERHSRCCVTVRRFESAALHTNHHLP